MGWKSVCTLLREAELRIKNSAAALAGEGKVLVHALRFSHNEGSKTNKSGGDSAAPRPPSRPHRRQIEEKRAANPFLFVTQREGQTTLFFRPKNR